ncbi:MAG: molecular chaperone TorD family protein [Polyangiaceae bacterium]|nr:molecular chaperone TorD family protein [Polyangiaceae bacterium]
MNTTSEMKRQMAIVRAEGYRVLAVLFGETDTETLSEEASAAASGPLGEFFAHVGETIEEDIVYEHTRMFAQGVAVCPCETSYSRRDKGSQLGQLSALYGLFGAKLGGAESEAPDHICVELEFASLLCLKEALALENGDEENANIAHRAQEVLLCEHLGAFVPRFVQRLVTSTDVPYYQAIAESLARFITWDLERNGWQPEKWAAQLPMMDAEEFDRPVCPMAAEA